MAEGKKITLTELFARKRAEAVRFYESPEGKAQRERNDARYAEDEAARIKWEAEHPPTPQELGEIAFANDEEREAPEEMNADDQAWWLAGYDEAQEAARTDDDE